MWPRARGYSGSTRSQATATRGALPMSSRSTPATGGAIKDPSKGKQNCCRTLHYVGLARCWAIELESSSMAGFLLVALLLSIPGFVEQRVRRLLCLKFNEPLWQPGKLMQKGLHEGYRAGVFTLVEEHAGWIKFVMLAILLVVEDTGKQVVETLVAASEAASTTGFQNCRE